MTSDVTSSSRTSGGKHAAKPPPRSGDLWLIWLLALGSIVVPTIALLCIYFIPKNDPSWYGVYIALKRGDFLIPVMFLNVETIRCWWREAKPGSIARHCTRLLATIICIIAALVCTFATVIGPFVPVSPEAGRSIAELTLGCLCVALVFGTAAVWVSTKRGEADNG